MGSHTQTLNLPPQQSPAIPSTIVCHETPYRVRVRRRLRRAHHPSRTSPATRRCARRRSRQGQSESQGRRCPQRHQLALAPASRLPLQIRHRRRTQPHPHHHQRPQNALQHGVPRRQHHPHHRTRRQTPHRPQWRPQSHTRPRPPAHPGRRTHRPHGHGAPSELRAKLAHLHLLQQARR